MTRFHNRRLACSWELLSIPFKVAYIPHPLRTCATALALKLRDFHMTSMRSVCRQWTVCPVDSSSCRLYTLTPSVCQHHFSRCIYNTLAFAKARSPLIAAEDEAPSRPLVHLHDRPAPLPRDRFRFRSSIIIVDLSICIAASRENWQ